MEAFAYFPTLVYRDEQPAFVPDVLPICSQYLARVRQSGWNMTQSEHIAHEPALRKMAEYLLFSSVNMLRDQGYLVDKYEFYLSGMWAQEVSKGGSTNVHVHKNSQVCGWFFLEVPENGAYPIYNDPRINKEMVELDFEQGVNITNATNLVNFNNVRPGTALFSNSWMKHQLVCGPSETPTRCIHFIVSHRERMCSM